MSRFQNRFAALMLLCVCAVRAWVPPSSQCSTTRSNSVALQSQMQAQPPAGASIFEQWCRKQGCEWNAGISHGVFARTVRGLQWNGKGAEKVSNAIRIPNSIVLQVTDDSDKNKAWDAQLALLLWKEMQLGASSEIAGYCRWLASCSGDDDVEGGLDLNNLPSTAPNALRHWTLEEKQAFAAAAPAGQTLVDLQARQEAAWRAKYQEFAAASDISWEAFAWCLEVVHSRAFRGISSSVTASLVSAVAAPAAAAAAGWYYATVRDPLALTNKADDAALIPVVLAGVVLAFLPTIFLLLRQTTSVALLPLIDSANHLATAESKIEFDPRTSTFDLTLDPNTCVDTATSQLYITYGDQSDAALLLNHGFLPGVPEEDDPAAYRQALAKAYLDRCA